jgi:peptide/nickel transport system permease protein
MGILVIGAVLTLIGNLLADISYALVDPRVRIGKE